MLQINFIWFIQNLFQVFIKFSYKESISVWKNRACFIVKRRLIDKIWTKTLQLLKVIAIKPLTRQSMTHRDFERTLFHLNIYIKKIKTKKVSGQNFYLIDKQHLIFKLVQQPGNLLFILFNRNGASAVHQESAWLEQSYRLN